jgi:hypothetical protein
VRRDLPERLQTRVDQRAFSCQLLTPYRRAAIGLSSLDQRCCRFVGVRHGDHAAAKREVIVGSVVAEGPEDGVDPCLPLTVVRVKSREGDRRCDTVLSDEGLNQGVVAPASGSVLLLDCRRFIEGEWHVRILPGWASSTAALLVSSSRQGRAGAGNTERVRTTDLTDHEAGAERQFPNAPIGARI